MEKDMETRIQRNRETPGDQEIENQRQRQRRRQRNRDTRGESRQQTHRTTPGDTRSRREPAWRRPPSRTLFGEPQPGSGPLKPPSPAHPTRAAAIRRPRPRPPPRVSRTSGAVRAPGAEARWPAAEAGPRREPSAGGSPAMHHPPSGR